MPLANEKQFFEIVGNAKKILVPLPKESTADTLGSALAFALALRKLGKEVELRSEQSNFDNLTFLPALNTINNNVEFQRVFVISVDMKNAKIEEVSYQNNHGVLDINLAAREGVLLKDDIGFASCGAHDLIVCINTPSLELLGDLYSNNAEIFFNTPKINIDNSINNGNYATVNLVDVTAASTAEIVFELLKKYSAQEKSEIIDADVATALLSGIISETNSFQSAATTPRAFEMASELVAAGARQQEIVRHLFKTKELSVLKLLGRAMARVRSMRDANVLYTVVTAQDIERSEIEPDKLLKVAHEFIASVSSPKLLFFVYEQNGKIQAYVHTSPNIRLAEIINNLGGEFIGESLGHAVFKDVVLEDIEHYLVDFVNGIAGRIGL